MTHSSNENDGLDEAAPSAGPVRVLWEIPGTWRFPSPQELADHFEARIRRGWRSEEVEPAADVFVFQNEVWIEVDLPGVEQGQVSARLEGGAVWIEATRHLAPPSPAARATRLERPRGRIRRRIPLPTSPPTPRLEVRLEGGVLRVRIASESSG